MGRGGGKEERKEGGGNGGHWGVRSCDCWQLPQEPLWEDWAAASRRDGCSGNTLTAEPPPLAPFTQVHLGR